MSDKIIKSIKKIKKKNIKKRLETIIEEHITEEPEKTIKPILICDGECVKCINTNCV
mgnify:CR=1 FL=1